jgi:diguanylate cyclase (GGDEF)-like protein
MDARDIVAACLRQKQQGSLLCIAGTNADLGMHVLVEEKVLIGRDPPHGLQLHDGGISRSHAMVERRGESYVIRDLGSTNGTLVNGVHLAGEQVLREGDKILLSQTVLKFTMVDQTEAVYLRQVDQLVGTDDLTGLISKHRFDAILKEAIRTALAAGLPLAAMMMDMDGLKAVNDRHGHHAGAETIRQVGGLIGRILAGKGEACRFGGDEFSAFVTAADLTEALRFAERIRSSVEELRVSWKGFELAVSISIGLATLTPEIADAAALLHQADLALYRAKAAGKNRICT